MPAGHLLSVGDTTTGAIAPGVSAAFWDTYLPMVEQNQARLGKIMDLTMTTRQRKELFFRFNSALHPELWPTGETIPEDSIDGVGFNGTVKRWGARASWDVDDIADDQTGGAIQMAMAAAENFALIDERVFFDYLTATASFIDVVPNAPDGQAYFSTTNDGTNDRFGVTSGNLLTGTGTATNQIQDDIFSAIQQFALFQDTKGQPLIPSSFLQQFMIVAPVALQDEIGKAVSQDRPIITQTFSGTDLGNTPTNALKDIVGGSAFETWFTPRLTGSAYYIFATQVRQKSTAKLDRAPIEEKFTRMDSDGDAQKNNYEAVQWKKRSMHIILEPFSAIKIDN